MKGHTYFHLLFFISKTLFLNIGYIECCNEITKYDPLNQYVYYFTEIVMESSFSFDVNLQQNFYIKKSGGYLHDCIIINKQSVFTDNAKSRLLIYTRNGSYNRDIKLSGKPFCAAKINENDVAVSYNQNYIEVIEINTKKVKNKIETSGKTYGISYKHELLYVVIQRMTVEVLSLTGKKIRSFQCPSSSIWYILADTDKLYVTDQSLDPSPSLHCCDLKGSVVWTLTNEKMNYPWGITTDGHSNVYVAFNNSENVVVISPNGKHHKEILSEKNGLKFPSGIYYDKTNNRLMVCNEMDGGVFIFDIKQTING